MENLSTIDDEFIKIDPEADEKELVAKFEDDTDRTLYPAQSERIQISLISYYANIVMSRVKEGFKMFFLRFMNRFFLELWGEMMDCPPIEHKQAHDILLVKLYEPYLMDKTLPKGSRVATKDGEYFFLTDNDLTIKAGQTEGQVPITSELAGSLLNSYGAGDINELVENFPYIESVRNINGASGGEDVEETEHYRNRLYLAPSKFSVAGPSAAYRFYALSAHQKICDVAVVTPDLSASIEVNGVVYSFETNTIENENFSATVDYTTGAVEITAIQPVSSFKVIVPPVFTVYIFVLTDEGEPTEDILEAVRKKLSSELVRPMLDNVLVFAAQKINKSMSVDIVLSEDADLDITKKSVEKAIASYTDNLRLKLNSEIVPSDIVTMLRSIGGVYDAVPDSMKRLPKLAHGFYDLDKTINYTRI